MANTPVPQLPPKYYLDYFRYLLDFVQRHSGHLLAVDDESFIALFQSLSEDAQCLVLRMANRKGLFFRMEKLDYQEIGDLEAAAEELEEVGLMSREVQQDPSVFTLFTKGELHALFPERGYKNQYKDEVLADLSVGRPADFQQIFEQHEVLTLLCQDQFEFFKFLFFGHLHGQMTEFVVRDIGHVKLENLEGHAFKSWFETREEALAAYELSRWNGVIRQAFELLSAEEVWQLVNNVAWDGLLCYPGARGPGDKLMLRVGEYFEKQGMPDAALLFYARALKHPARERRVRIDEKAGNRERAVRLAEEIVEQPWSPSERIFAQDFLEKSGRTYRSTTRRQQESPEIWIRPQPDLRVESQVLEHLQQQGYAGWHTENYLWRALFGLTFWEILFDQRYASFHHPLQRMPADLDHPDFLVSRQSLMETHLTRLTTGDVWMPYLETVAREKGGINNPLVTWHELMLPSVLKCVQMVPPAALGQVLLEMARNMKAHSTGFPDLFVWKDEEYQFFEVKSPNDHLSAQQLFWLDFFAGQGIKSEILRVKYHSI